MKRLIAINTNIFEDILPLYCQVRGIAGVKRFDETTITVDVNLSADIERQLDARFGDALESKLDIGVTDKIKNMWNDKSISSDHYTKAIHRVAQEFCKYCNTDRNVNNVVDMDVDDLLSTLKTCKALKDITYNSINFEESYIRRAECHESLISLTVCFCVHTYNIVNPLELSNIDDKVGDKFELSKQIDYDNRDYPIVYLDGEFIKGEKSDTHTMILNQYLENNKKERLSEEWYRSSVKEVRQKTKADSVAFGHVIGNCVFIDTVSVSNVNVNNVIKEAVAWGGFDKGYAYNRTTIERIARLANKEIVKLQQHYRYPIHVQLILERCR